MCYFFLFWLLCLQLILMFLGFVVFVLEVYWLDGVLCWVWLLFLFYVLLGLMLLVLIDDVLGVVGLWFVEWVVEGLQCWLLGYFMLGSLWDVGVLLLLDGSLLCWVELGLGWMGVDGVGVCLLGCLVMCQGLQVQYIDWLLVVLCQILWQSVVVDCVLVCLVVVLEYVGLKDCFGCSGFFMLFVFMEEVLDCVVVCFGFGVVVLWCDIGWLCELLLYYVVFGCWVSSELFWLGWLCMLVDSILGLDVFGCIGSGDLVLLLVCGSDQFCSNGVLYCLFEVLLLLG